MLLDYACGGELFTLLRREGRFSNDVALFFATEIVLAFDYLHGMEIAYRDLKPENLLIDKEGHVKITDFGFAKVVQDKTYTLCGTPEYLAPEIIQSRGHNKNVDWWALGVLVFEMLAGYPPFYDDNPLGIYQKIMDGYYEFPPHVEPKARDLVKSFLCADRNVRLGFPRVSLFKANRSRTARTRLKVTSGSGASISKWFLTAECHRPGCPRSKTWLTRNTLTDTPSRWSRTQCRPTSSSDTSTTSDRLNSLRFKFQLKFSYVSFWSFLVCCCLASTNRGRLALSCVGRRARLARHDSRSLWRSCLVRRGLTLPGRLLRVFPVRLHLE